MRKLILAVMVMLCAHPAAAQMASPALNANDWNFVLVPTFDVPPKEQATNNLSVTGLNHSLRFGQILKGLTSGKDGQIRQIYALTSADDPNDMAALESIEPFALLTNRAVSVKSVNTDDPAAYNSPAALVGDILGNHPRGIYLIAAPSAVIVELAQALTGAVPAISENADYLVAFGSASPLALNIYDDGIAADAEYPDIPLPAATTSCPSVSVTISATAPSGLNFYVSQTVHLIRHVEAHPTNSFENGNYVCQGQWRALGANSRLKNLMPRLPGYVFSSNPHNLIGCGDACSYIRPALTAAPFAIQNGLPLTLATFKWDDPEDLARALFDRDSPYFPHAASDANILVAWEHGNLQSAVKKVFKDVYQNPQAADLLPRWSFSDYDTVWILSTDEKGTLTFTNSCEHIPTASLPSTCPAFWQ